MAGVLTLHKADRAYRRSKTAAHLHLYWLGSEVGFAQVGAAAYAYR